MMSLIATVLSSCMISQLAAREPRPVADPVRPAAREDAKEVNGAKALQQRKALQLLEAQRLEADAAERANAPNDSVKAFSPLVADAIKADPKDSAVRKLQKARISRRVTYLQDVHELIDLGRFDSATLPEYLATHTKLAADLAELADNVPDRIKYYELMFDKAKFAEVFVRVRVETQNQPRQDVYLATAARLDIEIELARLKDLANSR